MAKPSMPPLLAARGFCAFHPVLPDRQFSRCTVLTVAHPPAAGAEGAPAVGLTMIPAAARAMSAAKMWRRRGRRRMVMLLTPDPTRPAAGRRCPGTGAVDR